MAEKTHYTRVEERERERILSLSDFVGVSDRHKESNQSNKADYKCLTHKCLGEREREASHTE